MKKKTFSIEKAVSDGWNGVKEFPVPAIVGFFVYLAVSFFLSIIPFLNFVFALIIAPALTGGFIILVLNVVDKNNPKIENIFEGFQKFGRFLGVYWLMVLIMALCYIPGAIFVALGASRESTFLMIIGALLILFIVLPIGIRLSMSFFIIADSDSTITEAIKKSFEITKGNILKILLYAIISVGIYILGFICLIIGILVAIPIIWIGFASIYRQLSEEAKTETA